MAQLDFRWIPYREDIGLFGKKGEGKTDRCRKILNLVPNIPRLIWSPQKPLENFKGYADPITKFDEIQRGAYVWNGVYNKYNFIEFCKRAMKLHDLLFIVDDVHEYVTKQFMPPEFEVLVMSGRNRGISGIYLSPLPSRVPNQILGNLSHMFAFKFNLQVHIEWMMNNFFGTDAWILIDKQKRHPKFENPFPIEELPQHSFLYHNDGDNFNQLIVNGSRIDYKINTRDIQSNNDGVIDGNQNSSEESNSLSRNGMPQEIQQLSKSEHPLENETRSELQSRDD